MSRAIEYGLRAGAVAALAVGGGELLLGGGAGAAPTPESAPTTVDLGTLPPSTLDTIVIKVDSSAPTSVAEAQNASSTTEAAAADSSTTSTTGVVAVSESTSTTAAAAADTTAAPSTTTTTTTTLAPSTTANPNCPTSEEVATAFFSDSGSLFSKTENIDSQSVGGTWTYPDKIANIAKELGCAPEALLVRTGAHNALDFDSQSAEEGGTANYTYATIMPGETGETNTKFILVKGHLFCQRDDKVGFIGADGKVHWLPKFNLTGDRTDNGTLDPKLCVVKAAPADTTTTTTPNSTTTAASTTTSTVAPQVLGEVTLPPTARNTTGSPALWGAVAALGAGGSLFLLARHRGNKDELLISGTTGISYSTSSPDDLKA